MNIKGNKNVVYFLIGFSVLLFITFLLLIINIFSINRNGQNNKLGNSQKISPTPVPLIYHSYSKNERPTLKNLIPDVSSKNDVIKAMGGPTDITQENGYTIYGYPVLNNFRESKIYIDTANKVKYITEEIPYDNSLYHNYVAKKQIRPDGILYDITNGNVGFKWLVFAQDGVAFLANDVIGGYTIEIRYFTPMNYQQFLTTLAPKFNMATTDIEKHGAVPQ